jgi:hypothetical protein
VETDEAAFIVGFQHEKKDRRDDGDIRQHSGNVVSHPRGRRGGRYRGPAAACRAHGRAIGNLGTTHIAKRHWKPPGPWLKTRLLSLSDTAVVTCDVAAKYQKIDVEAINR